MGRIILTVCAVVGAVALGAAAEPQRPAPAQQPTKAAAKGLQQPPTIISAQAKPKPKRQGNNQEASGAPLKSEPSPWYDLWAQILMALWAFGQLILTGVGIFYIRKTLRATEAAVEEAQKGSDAAVQMAIASREQFVAERRPWMSQQNLEAVEPMENMEIAFKVNFKNVGASPAFDVAVVFDVDIDDYSFTKIEDAFQDFLRSRMAAHQGGEVVFPGDDHSVTHHLQFSRRDLKRRDEAWSRRNFAKPALMPRVFYAVFYRSPIRGEDGARTIHHTGGCFSLYDWKGEVLVGAPNPPERISMIARRTTADFLVS